MGHAKLPENEVCRISVQFQHKLGQATRPNLISRDSHMTTQPRPSIRQAEMEECSSYIV